MIGGTYPSVISKVQNKIFIANSILMCQFGICLIKWFTWGVMQVLFLLYKDRPCNYLKYFDMLLCTKEVVSFLKSKNYVYDVWNEFISNKSQNSHGINGRGYNPV